MSPGTLKACAHCRILFHPFPKNKLYCSEDCSGKAKRIRFKEHNRVYSRAWRARRRIKQMVNNNRLDAESSASA
jgi:hypothetical protein